ncbi:helix-turn-helix domain-containing protein [Allokutzneria multivorans]|uniref:Helix-turn-helix domain-containing protein n=1 Tax=Allokutzneria multivorans TaxID=1142134 RepID=A0ABP7SHL2_9PSEU
MLGRTYERENCSAARALELIGERWSLLIIRNAVFADMRRFSDFERRLGVAPNILAKRLDGFVADGLMRRGGDGDYLLTEKGRQLGTVIIALTEWGDRWLAPKGPPILFEHEDCGGPVHVHARCEDCAQQPTAPEVVAVAGPGADPDRRPPRDPSRPRTS